MSSSLLKLQIGPVQDFIAQARSTRDLWSGSYLLSWLVTAGLCELVERLEKDHSIQEAAAYIIFPNLQHQPLFELQRNRGNHGSYSPQECLTPNVPNLFVAALPVEAGTATQIAGAVERAIRDEWERIAKSCWDKLTEGKLVNEQMHPRFFHQIANFLSVSWQCTPWEEGYETAYKKNCWQLDAVRQTRVFHGWGSGQWRRGEEMNKDSLTGREEAICGGNEWWERHIKALKDANPKAYAYWRTVFRERQSGDRYGAVTLVKRLWHRVYLAKEENGGFEGKMSVAKKLPIPSTYQAANHDPEKDVDAEREDLPDEAQRYFALLAMDGDNMGAWLIGDKSLKIAEDSHRGFSAALSGFALTPSRDIVASPKHQGCLVYAGGDDVLALLPADTALACARELRDQFKAYVENEINQNYLKSDRTMKEFDVSVGIAIAHFKEPLQDVVRAAQAAERRAKNELGRKAFSVTLIKHSGETVHWGCKWEAEVKGVLQPAGTELYHAILDGIQSGVFSARFPHRLVETLAHYLPGEAGVPESIPAFQAAADQIIAKEFGVVLDRQRGSAGDATRCEFLEKRKPGTHLANYLASLNHGNDPVATKLRDVIGLCQTVAFAVRNQFDSKKSGETVPQPVAETNVTT